MVESFTGYENIYLGCENDKNNIFSGLSRKKMKQEALKLVAKYPMDIDVEKPVYLLSAIEREIIAVLRALSKKCEILVLDEPTSILTEKEKHVLFSFVKLLKDQGVSIIYITHHLDEVALICDSFTVFRGGHNIGHEEIVDGKVDAEHIAEMMLGQRFSNLYPEKIKNEVGGNILGCRKLSLNNKLDSISFDAPRGVVTGIFGLVGSGIDELSKILFGAMLQTSGDVLLKDKVTELKSPKDAIAHRIFLIPGDRKKEGMIGNFGINRNLTLSKLSKVVNKAQLVKTREENRRAAELVDELQIATTNIFKKAQDLSGGNQQKVVVGKGLFTEADVYIFCEPTVGVDVGAKKGIYEIMRRLAKESAVIIVSSDPEEVLGTSDRIMVLNQGKMTLKCEAEDTTLQQMLVKATSNQ